MNEEPGLDSIQATQIEVDLKKAVELHRQGELETALGQYLEIIRKDAENADAFHLAGLTLLARKEEGDLDLSLRYLKKAIDIDNSQSTFYNDLGNAYWNFARIPEAVDAFSNAARLDPNFVQPRFNLGNCYWFQGEFKLASQAYNDTLRINEDWVQARYMLACCEYALGNTVTAISIYRDVISRRVDFVDAKLGLAYALLRTGQWREGWQYFENRLLYSDFSLYHQSVLPQWDGHRTEEKSLLVFAEQGIGDTLHFFRYLSMARARVGRLVLVCDRSLHLLFSRRAEIDELIDRETIEVEENDAHFDYRISLMSLAKLFQTTVETTWTVPYFHVDKDKTSFWKNYLDSSKLKVGLVWAGNPSQKDDKYRSCKLKQLAPLFKLQHIRFYSLQKGEAREQIEQVEYSSLLDIADELHDFSDTAAVIANLDLVISVDTAVAHLAGSLGKPVWTMLWYSHCWRYLENRTDSPWYPTMRLFRQREIHDWSDVVGQIRMALVDKGRKIPVV